MSEHRYQEDPLESLLDDESSEEFGEPVLKDPLDPGAREHVDGNLANWSAADFASIHVRFRPHLERHARRYLQNPVQAEEVVQEAFLYLMTTLPEIDSELGVLKFLKWKIRLLCLDVLRSAASQRETFVADYADYASTDPELAADLERAEDNAVIRSALAKLNPRHREALIASVYEEKSSDEVAKQLELTPNGARQLLFRARSAFRKALVGEAEIQGRSISQVLSVAAKKAALEAKSGAFKVGVLLVMVAVGVGVVPSLFYSDEVIVAGPSSSPPLITDADQPNLTESETGSESNAVTSTKERVQSGDSDNFGVPLADPDAEPLQVDTAQDRLTQTVPDTEYEENIASLETQYDPPIIGVPEASFESILATDISSAGIYQNSYAQRFSEVFAGTSIEVFGGTGISAFLDVDTNSRAVNQIVFHLQVDDSNYFGFAGSVDVVTRLVGDGYIMTIRAEEIYVVDSRDRVFSESPVSEAEVLIELYIEMDGSPRSASFSVG